MPYYISLTVTPTVPDTIGAVTIITLTRSDTGLTPAGVTLPIGLTLVTGQWQGEFADSGPTPAPFYDYQFTITFSNDDSTSRPVDGIPIQGAIPGVDQVTGTLYTLDGQGNAAGNIPVTFQFVRDEATPGTSPTRAPFVVTSNSFGVLQAFFELGATYRMQRGSGEWVTFVVPNADFLIQQVIGS